MSIKLNESYYALIEAVQNGDNVNEVNSKFKNFIDALTRFSVNEKQFLLTFRTLSQIKIDVCSKGKVIDLTMFDLLGRITALLEVEIKVTLLKLKNPVLAKMDKPSAQNDLELLNWTDDKIKLVALIYAIARSINNGNAKIKKIVRCFEYIFQISLGNVYDVLHDLNIRKEGPCKYLMELPDHLLKKLDELNSKK